MQSVKFCIYFQSKKQEKRRKGKGTNLLWMLLQIIPNIFLFQVCVRSLAITVPIVF